MIIDNVIELGAPPIFFRMENFSVTDNLYVKLEGLNVAGSIKIKTAASLISALESKYSYHELIKKQLVCSSSGNLAIALSIICNVKNYNLLCISDPNISLTSKKLIESYGAKIHMVTENDENGGYLAKRIEYIQSLLDKNDDHIWFNQYANPANLLAHYHHTAKEIADVFSDRLTHLFIGAGTTGTLMGCASFFKEKFPNTKIIAVDAYGSVTFDKKAAKRNIPGLGTSKKPSLLNKELVDEVLFINEIDTISTCYKVVKQYSLLLGGSSGTVLAAVQKYKFSPNDTVVAISPDFGDKYLDTVYDKDWVKKHYFLEEKIYV